MTHSRSTEQQEAEAWRQHMADQAEQQTRELREIANNTAWTKALAIIFLALLVLGVVISLLLGPASGL